MIDNSVKTNLLKLARETIERKFIGSSLDLELYTDDIYNEKRGAFVTLHKEGQLRGCIGYIIAY
ncbi:MAG: AMMECR1 domain-containing protein, partial [Candidatus Cloacimonadales bacterium]|nr:AMMECR1 domain-containing protein [Candidatus Cloacimonadales bacterium]